MKNKLQTIAVLGLASVVLPHDQHEAFMDYEEKPKMKLPYRPKPPKGTREYFFNSLGEFSNDSMLKSECVFMCYAINDNNAKRKFAKWQKTTIQ